MALSQATRVRFIHSADWQLGMTRHFLSAEAQARYSEARLEAIKEIAKLAEVESCAFVVVSGDVFDSNHLDRQVVVRALDAMSSFTVPLFLLPANHDSANAASVYRSSTFLDHRPKNLIVLDTFAPVAIPGADAELVGAPWDSKQPLEDLVAKACAELTPAGNTLRVLVAHGAVDEGNPDQQNPSLIRMASVREAIASGLIHYLALGDRHSVTRLDPGDRIWYSGTPLVTDFTENEPNKVLVVDLDGESVKVEARQVGFWTFLKESFPANNREEVDAIAEWLEAIADKRSAVVKLSFVGTLNLTEKAHLDEVLNHYSDLFAALETWERHTDLVVLPDEEDLLDLGLTGFAAATLEDLREQARSDGEAGEVAQDALSLLFRLARAGS
jgi:DNA repair exonuclease SbcCD nuclease subunit